MSGIIGCLRNHCPNVMESPDYLPAHVDASRPSLGFPLGIALLLIIIFSLSGIFSCYYHWDKLRSLRRSFSDTPHFPAADSQQDTTSAAKFAVTLKEKKKEILPVLMPGDRIPKFIALPCPRQPPAACQIDKVNLVQMKKPTVLPFVPVPFYL